MGVTAVGVMDTDGGTVVTVGAFVAANAVAAANAVETAFAVSAAPVSAVEMELPSGGWPKLQAETDKTKNTIKSNCGKRVGFIMHH